MNIVKLGTKVKDSATGLAGMLTHFQVEMDERGWYRFQPAGLNPEDGQPVKAMWIVPERVNKPADTFVELPLEVLGTQVIDRASGFKGQAINVVLHISGCVHVGVQPNGVLDKTRAPIDSCDFDIRRLAGDAIQRMTDEERAADQKAKPSPGPMDKCGPRDPDSHL
jgi:hypothetical protein